MTIALSLRGRHHRPWQSVFSGLSRGRGTIPSPPYSKGLKSRAVLPFTGLGLMGRDMQK